MHSLRYATVVDPDFILRVGEGEVNGGDKEVPSLDLLLCYMYTPISEALLIRLRLSLSHFTAAPVIATDPCEVTGKSLRDFTLAFASKLRHARAKS